MRKLPPGWIICRICSRLHRYKDKHLNAEQKHEAGGSWSYWVGHTPYLAYSRWRECADADKASRNRRIEFKESA